MVEGVEPLNAFDRSQLLVASARRLLSRYGNVRKWFCGCRLEVVSNALALGVATRR